MSSHDQEPTHDTHGIDELPPYASMLFAFNRSFADDMRRILADLPLPAQAKVLDVACGDGSFSVWLAERIDQQGQVIGLDRSGAYLNIAQRAAAENNVADRVRFDLSDSATLPFDDNSFDLVWCAHSLYSLPDTQATLKEMLRVTRPGGTVAVLENDPLHHLLLPWPMEIELAVRQAHVQAIVGTEGDNAPLYVGRDLRQVLTEAGVQNCEVRTYTAVRNAPLSADDCTFVTGYLADVRERAQPFLEQHLIDQLDTLLDPNSPDALLAQPTFWMSSLEIMAFGAKA